MLSLTRPPMLISNINEPDHLLFECLERGVSCRALDRQRPAQHAGLARAHARQHRARRGMPHRRVAAVQADRRRPASSRSSRSTSRARTDRCCSCVPRRCSKRCAKCSSCSGATRRRSRSAMRSRPATAAARSASLLSLLTSGLNDKAIEARTRHVAPHARAAHQRTHEGTRRDHALPARLARGAASNRPRSG